MSEANQAMDAEQAQDLAALQALAEEGPRAPGEPEPEPIPQRLPLEQEIAGALKLVSGVVKPILPTVAEIYSDETCDTIGGAVAPVCNKYGWLQDGLGGRYGEEIMCLVVVGPILYATVIAARGDLARRQDTKQAAALDGVDAGKAVQVGAPIENS